MHDEEKIQRQIDTLQDEHLVLETALQKANMQIVDLLEIQRIKRRKLMIKDEVSRLHGMLLPDIIA